MAFEESSNVITNNDDNNNTNNSNSIRNNQCCAGCREPIKDRFIFSVIDLCWHQDCVQCNDCSLKLNERCYEIEGKLYCKLDYWRRFGPKCFACQESIDRSELVQRIQGNRVYHLKCFTCNDCHKQLKAGDQMHLVDDKKLLCKQDYNQLAAATAAAATSSNISDNKSLNSPSINSKSNGFTADTTNGSQQTYFTLTSSHQQRASDKSLQISKNGLDPLNEISKLDDLHQNHHKHRSLNDSVMEEDELEEEEGDYDEHDDDDDDEDDGDDGDEIDDDEDEDSQLQTSGLRLHPNDHLSRQRLGSNYNEMDNNNLENEENRSNLAADNQRKTPSIGRQSLKVATSKRKRRRRQKQQLSSMKGGKKLASRNGESILNVSGAYVGSMDAMGPTGQQISANRQQQEHHQQHQQQQQQQQHSHHKSVSSSASTASNSSTGSSVSQRVVHHQSSNNNNSNTNNLHQHHHSHGGQYHGGQNNANAGSNHQAHHLSSGNGVGGGGQSSGGSSAGHKPTRVRTVLNEKQLQTLRECYGQNPRPDALLKEQLVEATGLSPRVIRVWFQNKRCKDKKKSILYKQMQQHEKDGRHLAGLTLMRGVPMVASSPIQYDDHSTVSASTPAGQQPGGGAPLVMMELGGGGPDGAPDGEQLASRQQHYANAVHSPAADIHAYQPPWDNLIDYAQQQPPGPTPPDRINAASPRYQQLIGQVHGYNGPSGAANQVDQQTEQANQFAANQAPPNGNYPQNNVAHPKHRVQQAAGQLPAPQAQQQPPQQQQPMGHLQHPFQH